MSIQSYNSVMRNENSTIEESAFQNMSTFLKKLVGEPGTGMHSIRIGNIAVVDVALTLIGAKIIANYFKIDYKKSVVGLFITGIMAHRIFNVRTTVDTALFRI
jgi:hypothetical protein